MTTPSGRHYMGLIANDIVNHPIHYKSRSGIETMDVIEAFAPQPNYDHEVFLWGNTIKYLTRYRQKGTPLTDLRKAKFYLDALVELVERIDARLKSAAGSIQEMAQRSKISRVQSGAQPSGRVDRKVSKKAHRRRRKGNKRPIR